jgi:endonuclease/exonuclease/phosphatase family metal-dependent hydrolase
MRVASFNLESFGNRPTQAASLDARIAVLRPQLNRLDADILCLQEVNADKSAGGKKRTLALFETLIADTEYEGFFRTHSVNPETNRLADKHNLVVLCRWPILETEQLWHTLVSPVSYRPVTAKSAELSSMKVTWDRPVLYCSVELPRGKKLHLLNLHFRAPLAAPIAGQKTGQFSWRTASSWAEGFFIAMLKRSGQALETRMLIDRIFDAEPDALILACGDFNAAEREVPIRIVGAGVDDTGNGDLADRALVNLERGMPESQRYTVIHHGEKLMLDHILISHALLSCYRHLEIHNELISDELFGFANVKENPESYHAPVVAEFDG